MTVREHYRHTKDIAAHNQRKVYTRAVIYPTISSLFKSFIGMSLQVYFTQESGACSELLVHVWFYPRSPMSLSTGGGMLDRTVAPVPAVRQPATAGPENTHKHTHSWFIW